MKSISFVWDERKAEANLKKHKIAFEEAKTVFSDPNARMIFDPDHSIEEDRFVLLGLSSTLRILVVCHCYLEDDMVIRIISARKANKYEQKQYEGFIS
jgi:uncharacterized DUF497 family protein